MNHDHLGLLAIRPLSEFCQWYFVTVEIFCCDQFRKSMILLMRQVNLTLDCLISVLDWVIPLSMSLEPVLESTSGGGDSVHDIVELLASFSTLKFPIELVLKTNLYIVLHRVLDCVLHQVPNLL